MKTFMDINDVRAMVKAELGLPVDERDDVIDEYGIHELVDVEDMGWLKDGTRWYTFKDSNGKPCVYYKYDKRPEYWNSNEEG